jgi:hypothetical protein
VRTVTLALVDPNGVALGAVALPGATPSPWWQEVGEVVDLARAAGLDVTVLRLLSADRPGPPGGAVTYLAECTGPVPPGVDRAAVRPEWTAPQRARMPWARPGGPAATLAWARQALDRPVSAARQVRSWNLSSIWRLTTATGPVWVKEVPRFAGHEGAVLRWLDGRSAPALLATEGCRTLLADIPGRDRHDATPTQREPMLAALLDLQAAAASRVPDLLALGVPDLRAAEFAPRCAEVLARWPAEPADRAVLADLVAGLPALFARLAACGVPDTLVHGDFHPGNVRGDRSPVLFDWGDSMVGHPALDLIRLRDWAAPAPALTGRWCRFWRRTVPGSDPEQAVALAAVLAPLRDAILFDTFLDGIEPAERPYHADDVRTALHTAADLHRTSQQG